MKPMRIAFLVKTYLPDHIGGTEIYIQRLAEGLVSRGHEVAVLYHGNLETRLQNEVYKTVVSKPLRAEKRVQAYRRALGMRPAGFQKFIDEWKPDLAHFHSFDLEAGLDHARALKENNIPYFLTYHLPAMTCLRATLLRWGSEPCDGRIDPQICGACVLETLYFPKTASRFIAKASLPWQYLPEGPWLTRLAMPSLVRELAESLREFEAGAKHFVACAKWVRELLILNDVPSEKITVLRQAMPGKTRTITLRLPLQSHDSLRLGFFGRLDSEKGLDLFFAAANLLRARNVPVVCEVVGPINNEAVRNLIEQQTIANADWISHLGTKNGDSLNEWIKSIDLMVMPSRCLETGPFTLLESWDLGTPAIGTNLGGIREFFLQNGLESLLFELESPQSIVEAVERVRNWKGPSPAVEVPGQDSLMDNMEKIYR